MINLVLQLNVVLFLLHLRVSNSGQQVDVGAGRQLGAGQGRAAQRMAFGSDWESPQGFFRNVGGVVFGVVPVMGRVLLFLLGVQVFEVLTCSVW